MDTARPQTRFRQPQPRPSPTQPQFQPMLPLRPPLFRQPLQQMLRPTMPMISTPPRPQPPPPQPNARPTPQLQPRPSIVAAPPQPITPPQPQPLPSAAPQPPAPPQQQLQRLDQLEPEPRQLTTVPSSTAVKIQSVTKSPPSPTSKSSSQVPTPPQSPKIIKSSSALPIQPPRANAFVPPLLPLPPSQLKPDPEPESAKTTLVHEVIKKASEFSPPPPPQAPAQKRDDSTASEEGRMRVISLAGENRGAYMELASPFSLLRNKKKQDMSSLRRQQLEENCQGNGEENGSKTASKRAPPMAAFVNSNVQSVNNSIVLNAKCAHNDPGVHLAFYRKPRPANGSHIKDQAN